MYSSLNCKATFEDTRKFSAVAVITQKNYRIW
jgi:hypothetical protein